MSKATGPFSQTLFLGASVIKFSGKIGWNTDRGEMQVQVVEDKTCVGPKVYYDGCGQPQITTTSDHFNPPKIGSPVYFRFGTFSYTGILRNWEQDKGTDSGTIYNITLSDPIELLEGIKVIVNHYNGGTFGVPNLLNVYGYVESVGSNCTIADITSTMNPVMKYTPASGYAAAALQQLGLRWNMIRYYLPYLANGNGGIYGTQIQLGDHNYYIDISELPAVDDYLRFPGDSYSIMDLISKVCDVAGYDFYCEILVGSSGQNCGVGGIAGHLDNAIKVIKVRTVDRKKQKNGASNVDEMVGSNIDDRLSLGKIGRFVGSGEGKQRASRGLELRHDITNAMIVGDYRQDLWQTTYDGSVNYYATIWPYWGLNSNNYPQYSEGLNFDHTVTIDISGWHPILVSLIGSTTYSASVKELLAAQESMSTWLIYMMNYKPGVAESLTNTAEAKLLSRLVTAIGNSDFVNPGSFHTSLNNVAIAALRQATDSEYAEPTRFFYDKLKEYVDEFFGKKYMVSLPFLCTNYTEGIHNIKTNWTINDSAWTDADVLGLSNSSQLLDRFKVEDGRIQAMCYINSGGYPIDFSNLSPDDVVMLSNTQMYVKCQVEKIVFLNPTTRYGPKAIITLPSAVRTRGDYYSDVPLWSSMLSTLLEDSGDLSSEEVRDSIHTINETAGSDTLMYGLPAMPIMPTMAAVPLLSNNLCYGPWYSLNRHGPPSKTDYTRDTSINPWTFGNTLQMSYGANVLVSSKITEQFAVEAGAFSLPGAPGLNRLGETLSDGAPEVTNIDVSVDPNGGVVTNYRLRSWVHNFGETGRLFVERLKKSGQLYQKIQRAFIRNQSWNRFETAHNWHRELTKPDRFNRQSTHYLLAGEGYLQSDGKSRNTVVTGDLRKTLHTLGNSSSYHRKVLMDQTGMFRPFSTNPSSSDLPSWVTPTAGEDDITNDDLNPFAEGHDIEHITRGDSFPEDGLSVYDGGYDTYYQGIGLRAPLILVGFGFDTNGKPVPNADPNYPDSASDEFLEDYLEKPHLWKAGPLDARWDEGRGVWIAGSGSGTEISGSGSTGSSTIIGILKENIAYGGSGLADIYGFNSEDAVVGSQQPLSLIDEEKYIYDIMLLPGEQLYSGTKVIINTIENESNGSLSYIVVNAICPCQP